MLVSDLSTTDCTSLLETSGIRVRMGPFVFCMKTTLPALAQTIHLLYAHYPIEPDDCFIDFEINVTPRSRMESIRGKRASFIIDGKAKFPSFKRELAIPMFEWAVNWCIFTRPHQYLILHSAVLEYAGRAIILPGQPGAGKSTLCAGLSLRQWRLLSDEVCVMRPPSAQLIPVPRPVGLKEESIEVIQRFEPGVIMGPATPGTRKGSVAHLQVDAPSVAKGRTLVKPKLIVFPSYKPNAGVELTPYSKAQTLLRVAQDAFNFSILGTEGFETLSNLVDASDCYTLTYSDMNAAIARLTDLVQEGSA